jgi:hypothetical protein
MSQAPAPQLDQHPCPSNSILHRANRRLRKNQDAQKWLGHTSARKPFRKRCWEIDYPNHYSISTGTCFIQITTNAPTYVLVELDDADEATMIGMVSVDFDSIQRKEGAVGSCVTSLAMNGGNNNRSSMEEPMKLTTATCTTDCLPSTCSSCVHHSLTQNGATLRPPLKLPCLARARRAFLIAPLDDDVQWHSERLR